MSSPRVLLIDIETTPNIGFTWRKYDQNVIKQIKSWEILSFAYKELGRGKVECLTRPDFKDRTDKSITKAIWKILDGADVIIAQNGDRFDVPKLRAKFVAYGHRPTSPFKTIDTKKIAKAHFGFYSNSLDDIAHDLGIGQKLKHSGFDLWEGCMSGFMTPGKINRRAWAEMRRYNCHDVVLLERVYLKVRPFHPSHPNFALYSGEGDKPECPICESTKVQRRGYHVMKVRRAARFHCQKCGHWFQKALSKVEK